MTKLQLLNPRFLSRIFNVTRANTLVFLILFTIITTGGPVVEAGSAFSQNISDPGCRQSPSSSEPKSPLPLLPAQAMCSGTSFEDAYYYLQSKTVENLNRSNPGSSFTQHSSSYFTDYRLAFEHSDQFKAGCVSFAESMIKGMPKSDADFVKSITTPGSYSVPATLDGKPISLNVGMISGAYNANCIWASDSLRKRFTMEEAMAIDFWFGGDSYSLNQALWAGGEGAKCVQPLVRTLESAMMKFPQYAGSLFRGSSQLPANVDRQYHSGNLITQDSFMSTSKSEEIVRQYFFDSGDGWLFKITSRDCRDISSFNSGEEEVLCLPGSKFHVDQRDDKNRIIRLTEVP